MKRPPNFTYWLDDVPPRGVTLLSALQHIGLVCSFLPIPLAVAREAGLTPDRMVALISVSMLALGATAILQVLTRGPVGSGLLAPSCFSGAYLAPSLLAVKAGGLPLVFGMTIFGGLIEAGLSRVLRYLRPFLPPEIAGFVVVMVGVTVGGLGVRYVLGVGAAAPASGRELAVSVLTLGLMVGLNVWGRGAPRLFCALLGIVGGYVAAAALGVLAVADFASVKDAPLVGVPSVGDLGWSFDAALVIPFAVGAMAACLKTVGDLTTCQRINDADWVRPDMRSIGRGTLANAIGSALAGFLGSTGVNTSSANIGLSGATGVTSRRIAYATGGIFLVLAFTPKIAGVLAVMPRPVMGAALMFVAAFIFVNGLQIIASRLLDARRTFVIGLSFIIAIAVDISPAYFRALPAAVQPLVGSSLVAGMLAAVLLNLVFRIGVRKVQRLALPAGHVDPAALEQFMDACGASWGARRDVIERAKFNLTQSIETLLSSGVATGPLEVEASFDEFDVDVRVFYDGPQPDLPEKRPSNEEIIASEEGERKLAGFMLRKFADRVSVAHKGGRTTILFHFDH
ncbi:MAG TPA: solute carrier family 23 protein [Burkholderiales bacterium]|nr:solute carrier family 23 protein [Burkholderiales bacterium]